VVGLELIIDDFKDKNRKFDAMIMAGNSYATLSKWQYNNLKKDDSLTKLFAFVKLDEAFNMALKDKNLNFDAQSLEFVSNLVNRHFFKLLRKYNNYAAEIYTMATQAKNLCDIYGVLPYEAATIIEDNLYQFNTSDILVLRKMLGTGVFEKPPNVKLNKAIIARYNRNDDYNNADIKEVKNYVVEFENPDATVWEQRTQL